MKGSKARATDWEGKVALAIGVGHIGWVNHRVSDTGVRGILTVPCSRGHDVDVEMPTKFPHDVIKKKLQAKGWGFHGRKPVCPDCMEHDRETRENQRNAVDAAPAPQAEKEVPMETSATAIAAATAQQSTPSARAKAARREVMQWLDESFELTGPEKGRYKAGINDATIAKETGCSTEAVAKIREEFFGALDKPKELDCISVEVGNLKLAAGELERTAKEAADELMRNARAEAEVIRRKADEIAQRLTRISREQGWTA